jgi:hypothetical protein
LQKEGNCHFGGLPPHFLAGYPRNDIISSLCILLRLGNQRNSDNDALEYDAPDAWLSLKQCIG